MSARPLLLAGGAAPPPPDQQQHYKHSRKPFGEMQIRGGIMHTYKVGNRTFTLRLPNHLVLLMAILLLLLLFFFLFNPSSNAASRHQPTSDAFDLYAKGRSSYNAVYPLTTPILRGGGQIVYRIAMVADLDTRSKDRSQKDTWMSYLKMGYLTFNRGSKSIEVNWDSENPVALTSGFALKGRGMELSELVVFNGMLLSFDDRTGLVYQIENNNKAIPWVLLTDGDGQISKGFKSEWATVKDEQLYVGSMGKEWTSSNGEFGNYNPMYVKVVTMDGHVRHVNWVEPYKAIRSAIGIDFPGYMIHESGVWSSIQKKWYFLPRRCSRERYNETKDETMGCNVLIECDESFKHIKAIEVGGLLVNPTRAYSSFKFIPGTNDQLIIALKSEEYLGKTATYYTAFAVDGEVLVKDTKIDTDLKYEGIEFV